MLKHAIRWIIPLVVLAVLAVALVVATSARSHAATIISSPSISSGGTVTPDAPYRP